MTSKVKQKTPAMGLCIDWETSGADWDGDSSITYQGVSFGAVIFNTTTFDVVDTLYCEIRFDESKYKWNDSAEAIHGLSREYLTANGMTREDAAVALAEFVLKYFGPDPTVMFLGHNGGFDIKFTRQLLGEFEIMFKLHHVQLDTASTGFITLGLFKSDLIFEALCLEERAKHNSLEDALYTVESCKRIRQLVNIALYGDA